MERTVDKADMTPGAGEQALRKRRRSFWILVAIGLAFGFVAGLVMGVMGGLGERQRIDPLVAWPVVGVLTAVFVWFSAAYYRRIDELDLADNLWANLVALHFYICAAPLWYFMHDIGQLPPVNHWAIWIATFAVVVIVYGARKLR